MMKAGLAQVDYTPELGLPLMGNFRDEYGAKGVHDPLCASALVLQGPTGSKAALLSVDICMLDRANVAYMRDVVRRQAEIPGDHVLIAATHTHSGPAPMELGSLPRADDGAIERFLQLAASAVGEANRQLADVELVVGSTTEDRLSFVRRLTCRDGETHMNWEGLDPQFVVRPLGRIDPQVAVLGCRRDQRTVGALVNFGLHPAILAGDNWLYSADYPGYLAEAMRKLNGPDFVTLFFNGCCGNVNHIDYQDPLQGRGYKATQRVGTMLAVDAYQALASSAAIQGAELAVNRVFVDLPRQLIDHEQQAWARDVLTRAAGDPATGQVDGLPDEHYARAWLDMAARQEQATTDRVEVMLLRIGNAAVVGLPGEVFSELGLAIKERSPARHTFVVELANDAIGYLPTREAFGQGGYEPTAGTTMYEPGAGEALVEGALQGLAELFNGKG